MRAFVPAMLDAFANPSRQPSTPAQSCNSDPQPTAPIGLAVGALRWLPKPSAVAALAGVIAGARLAPGSLLLRKVFSAGG